jgi:hypothetical protein
MICYLFTVNALFAIINTELESLTASGDNCESNITIDYYELIDKSIELCDILAIKLFESLDILQIETTDSHIKKIRLSPEYNNAEALNDVILKIEDFKK